MSLARLLVANRAEVAIRIARAAAGVGIPTVGVFSEDDAASLHVRHVDAARPLSGRGPRAYLDVEQLLAVARETGCDAVHPGYGFLSEQAGFARRCAEAGLTFVGPRPETLTLLGDKVAARALAERCGVPVLRGTSGPAGLEEARAFLAALGKSEAALVKAVAGGGGRGMRVVRRPEELDEAWARCRSEAQAAFGSGDLYVEALLPRARHVEVQVVGDGSGAVSHLGERDCTLQRRHQKLVEVAPAPGLTGELRARLAGAAVRMAAEVRYAGVGTFEFLLDADEPSRLAFIEANPRLQVEHTVTEEVTGIDLVVTQLALAAGRSLADLGLRQEEIAAPHGFALQVRVNMETLAADGTLRPSAGALRVFEVPTGPGIRVDTHGYAGYQPIPSFDSLLAKVVARGTEFAAVVGKAYRALSEFRVDGVATNLPFLRNLLRHPALGAYRVTTRFVDEHLAELLAAGDAGHRPPAAGLAGAKVDPRDPLAVLVHGKTASAAPPAMPAEPAAPEGTVVVRAPMQGTVVAVDVSPGDAVPAGGQLLVMEAMKMEHVVTAPVGGIVRALHVSAVEPAAAEQAGQRDPEHVRPDLAEVHRRHALTLDAARPDAVERRRKTGQRTARENVDDLCDPGSFVEYGAIVIAAQRRRRALDDLIKNTPADGMLAGIGRVNGELFDDAKAQCIVMSYDYTVLAGTQGQQNHRKKDRMFELARDLRLPVVFFTEGGGGRPGDTDGLGVAGLDCMAFNYWGKLSGLVPLIGINSGRCFAGNAALLGCCDVVIATKGSNIGMGGPAMIEGGGLGIFRPEEVGPMEVQVANGVVDIPVADEAEAVQVAKKYLSYFQGEVRDWLCAEQRLLRTIIPENRLRIYDVRAVIETLADTGSLLEIRRHFGPGMVTALIRIEGHPVGLIANNPVHLAGAIDSNGADKAARFMQLCDAFDIPILFLCDTPGIMVGPEVEKTALVRHACRMFVVGANVSVPFFTIILRKGYGLGAQAMAGGSFKTPIFTVAWPTGEFGGMGLEGAVKLGYRNELAAVEDPEKRKELFDEMVERMYRHGKAVNTASHFEIDDVIDPLDSRKWIVAGLRSTPPNPPRTGKKRPNIDTW